MKELGFVTPYKITIDPTCNKGFVVKIGCAIIVASSVLELKEILMEYLHDCEGWEKKYNELQKAEVTPEAPTTDDRPEEARG